MRQLYMRTDPRELDRYTKNSIPKRRKINREVQNNLQLLRRALHGLPPRELMMIFETKVLENEQDEICCLYNVRQSNISYRLDRATKRIKFFFLLNQMMSESEFRRLLIQAKFNDRVIRTLLGVCKTTSQTATAKAFGATQGNVRHVFISASAKLTERCPESMALEVLELVDKHFNLLRSIETQRRFAHKVRDSNYI